MKIIARAAAVAFSTAALALTVAPIAGAATTSTAAPAAVTLAPAHHGGGHHGWGGHHFRHWRDGAWYYDDDCNAYWFDGAYWHYGCED